MSFRRTAPLLLAAALLPVGRAAAGDLSVRHGGALSASYRPLRGAPGSRPATRERLRLGGREDVTLKWADAWAARLQVTGNLDPRNPDDDRLRLDDLYVSYFTDRLDLRLGYQIISWKALQTYSPADLPNSLDYGLDFLAPAKIGTLAARVGYTFTLGFDHTLTFYEFPRFERPILPSSSSPLYLFSDEPGVHYDADGARYGGRGDEYRQQLAVTYNGNLGGLADVLAFYFDGYRRLPLLTMSGTAPGPLTLREYYPLVHAFGATVQRDVGGILLSAEGVHTRYHDAAPTPSGRHVPGYWQWAVGAERTLDSLFGTTHELTLELELAGDSLVGRAEEDLEFGHVFRSSAFLSARYVFNDTARRTVRALVMTDWRAGDLWAGLAYRQELVGALSVEVFADGWLVARSALARTLRHGDKAGVSLVGSW